MCNDSHRGPISKRRFITVPRYFDKVAKHFVRCEPARHGLSVPLNENTGHSRIELWVGMSIDIVANHARDWYGMLNQRPCGDTETVTINLLRKIS